VSDLNRGWTVLLLALLSLASPRWLSAQEGSLGQVEQLASTGRAEEARAMLLEWWENDRSRGSRRDLQLGLWLRGRLTVDPAQAARDFRRLVIEYPGGPYADRALFRLAQAAYAQGDRERARTYMTSLTRDHPGSPVREQAEAWMARALTAGPPPVFRVVEAEESEDQQTAEPQLRDSVADPVPVVPRAAQDSVAPALSRNGRYTVQLGAFLDESRAEALHARASEAGLDVRLVRVEGSRLMHVRVGRFDSSAQASVSFQSVTALGFTAAVVRDALREEPVGE
jgi:cell division septation protein DedD